MTYEDFHAKLHRADSSVRTFAELIGMRTNSISNYFNKGEVPTHLAIIDTLMAELSDRAIDFRSVVESLDIVRKRPRGAAGNGYFLREIKAERRRQGRLDLAP